MNERDWFNEGFLKVMDDAAVLASITRKQAMLVYLALENAGLIDYDVEKEVYYTLIMGDH
jgi:hypothetical protein